MRKMKKFSEGGNAKYDAKYKRKVADIESDYAKAMKGKTGRAAEVAKAKYDQRMADAKDDLAKWTKSDRTETRAAEKSAERNLTMTRKFGAMKSAVKSDDVAKVSSTDDLLKSAPKPQMPSKPEAKSRPAPTRRAPATRQATPATKQEVKAAPPAKQEVKAAPVAKQKPPMTRSEMARKRFGELIGYGGTAASDARTQANTARMREQQAQRARWSDVETQGAKAAKLARLKAAAEAPGASAFAKQRYQTAVSSGSYAGGGTVKKKSTPPQPTPAERAASKRQDESLKKAKPTPADAGAIARGNRSSGMKKGGAVKKYAAGGLAKVMPTADQMGSLGMAKGGKAKMADKAGRALKKKSADTMGRAMMKKAGGGKCYAKGGSVSARADGCAVKGKTKGKMI